MNTLDGWSRRLRYVRFVHAVGGHANDGDMLMLALRYSDRDDLAALLRSLGVEAPGWCTLGGVRVFVYVTGRVELMLSDAANPYVVTASTVEDAERIERMIQEIPGLLDRVIDPPVEHSRCICPRYHPRVFEGVGDQ